LSEAVFRSGYDVKKSELHGMSQRGGSVCSEVRFGLRVLSPMAPPGEADFLLVLAPDQVEVNRGQLRPGGVLLAPELVDAGPLANRKGLNMALIGALSAHLEIAHEHWMGAMRACFPEKLHTANEQAFDAGRRAALARLSPANPSFPADSSARRPCHGHCQL